MKYSSIKERLYPFPCLLRYMCIWRDRRLLPVSAGYVVEVVPDFVHDIAENGMKSREGDRVRPVTVLFRGLQGAQAEEHPADHDGRNAAKNRGEMVPGRGRGTHTMEKLRR